MAKLYKEQSASEAKLREKKAKLGTAKQALSIEAADGEKKLQASTETWRTASRRAADELYEITSQRVANAGPGGWRELIRKRSWDDDERQTAYEKGGEEDEVCNTLIAFLMSVR